MTEAPGGPRDHLVLGVIVERRPSRSPWLDDVWTPSEVMVGGLPVEAGALLCEGDGWTRYYGGALELELHRRETEGYRRNLSNRPPVVYVVLRGTGAMPAFLPVKVTACPYEAETYLVSGEDVVEGVPMPDAVGLMVQDFVARHHVDQPFIKRKQRPKTAGRVGGGDG